MLGQEVGCQREMVRSPKVMFFDSLIGKGRLWSRLAWMLIGTFAFAVVGASFVLEPSPEGVGTHTQLGLSPCTFLVLTGYPCPSCGLTTCFTHLARFEIIEAFTANGPGILIFLVTVALVPLSMVSIFLNLPVLDTLVTLRGDIVAALLAGASLAGWVVEVGAIFIFQL